MGEITDPTLLIGLHGVLRLHPAIRRAVESGTLEEDVYSLVIKRTVAYGWSEEPGGGIPPLWTHGEAGSDLTQDGRVRQAAWLLVKVIEGVGLPLQAIATVLRDALFRIGDLELTGFHAVVPVGLGAESHVVAAYAAGWFALSDPENATTATVIVTTSRQVSDETAERVATLAGRIAQGRLRVKHEVHENGVMPGGVAQPPAGQTQAQHLEHCHRFLCHIPEWSLDCVVWLTSMVAESLRQFGYTDAALVSISRF